MSQPKNSLFSPKSVFLFIKSPYYLLALIGFVVLSCDSEDLPRDAYLPDANGQHGEILVLMDNVLWDGQIGAAVKKNLTRHAEGPYLRPEPMFSYFHKVPKELNHLNQLNRNLLKFVIDPDSTYNETAVFIEHNYFAKNQLFIIVKDSDQNRLLDFAKHGMDEIIDRFNEFEKEQLVRLYSDEKNKRANEIAEEKFGFSIAIPKRSVIKSDRPNFVLIKHDRSKNLMPNDATKAQGGTFWIQQGFMFWSEPYVADSNQLTIENVLKSRDTTLKKNVPGRVKGTYMATEYDPYYKPEGKIFEINGAPAVEIRGLWKHDGIVFIGGGGPFVQYSFLNEARNAVITVCGYIYAPKFDKREYIREIDAVLSTITLVD